MESDCCVLPSAGPGGEAPSERDGQAEFSTAGSAPRGAVKHGARRACRHTWPPGGAEGRPAEDSGHRRPAAGHDPPSHRRAQVRLLPSVDTLSVEENTS